MCVRGCACLWCATFWRNKARIAVEESEAAIPLRFKQRLAGLILVLRVCILSAFGIFAILRHTQVLCVRRFEEESEAVEAANSSEFGLAAAVMSSDEDRYVQRTTLLNSSW